MEKTDYIAYKTAIEEVSKFVNKLEELTEPSDCVDALTTLNSYLAMSVTMLAELKKIKRREELQVIESKMDMYMALPKLVANRYVNDSTADVSELIDLADGLNEAMQNIGDNLRTIISYRKEEMRLTKAGY